MEKMSDLKDLLKHEILDLYSAEEQIIEALPAMINKAQNKDLKKALSNHLKITEEHKKRLDKVKQFITDQGQQAEEGQEKKGLFSRLFSGSETQKCRGMEGLIDEGNKVMNEDINVEALDAAIIACAQKVEHYEISGYGTARAYAKELQLKDVEKLLEQTLGEEYEADDLLTQLAVGRLNVQAEQATSSEEQNESSSVRSPSREETRPNRKATSEGDSSANKPRPPVKKKENSSERSVNPKESGSSKGNNKEKPSAKEGGKGKKNSKGSSAKTKKSTSNKATAKSR